MLTTLEMVQYHGVPTAMPHRIQVLRRWKSLRSDPVNLAAHVAANNCCEDAQRRSCINPDLLSQGQRCWHWKCRDN